MKPNEPIRARGVWFFSAAVSFLFLFRLGAIPLWSGDEGRFGEIAREMVELRDFLIPHFFYLEFLEKPVLYPLLTALSSLVFGVNALAVRLPGAVAGLIGVWMTWRFTRAHFGDRAAVRAAAILATTIGYVLIGRFAIIDMVLTLFLSAALFCLAAACVEKRGGFYLAAYGFMGAAFLTKGLVGIAVPGMVFGLFLIWTRNLSEIKHMKIGWGVLILAAMILPYGIAVSARYPEFFYFFIVKQQFLRYSTGSFGRQKPLWFFIPIYLAGSLPWSFYLAPAVRENWKAKDKPGLYARFLMIWIVVVLVFFSLPKSKLPYYILSTAVPTAILIGIWFAGWKGPDLKGDRKILRVLMGLSWPVVIAGAVYATTHLKDPRAAALVPWIWLAAAVVIGSGILVDRWMGRGNMNRVFWTFAGSAYLFLLIAVGAMHGLSPYLSTDGFARQIQGGLEPRDITAVFASPDRYSDFAFHLKRRVMVVGSDHGTVSDASWSEAHAGDRERWFLDVGRFVQLFNRRERRVYCLMDPEGLAELEKAGLEGAVRVREKAGKILVCNQPVPASDEARF